MHATASVIAFCLIAFSFVWIYSLRPHTAPVLRNTINRITALPGWVFWPLAAVSFTLPVFEYWITAISHPNALAGFLPWADATEYFFCSQTFLLNLPGPDHCGKRPFYLAFFSDILWLTGNRMQLALLLQAVLVGLACLVLVWELRRDLPGQCAIAAFAVCYLYIAAFGAGLVMTENVGVLLGVLAVALFWRISKKPDLVLLALGTSLLAAAVSVRPGPLFVLPAVMCWYFFYGHKDLRLRLAGLVLIVGAILLGFSLSAIPSLVAGNSLGTTHSNFSFSLYGLVVGGKGWQQITIDHPEIFSAGLSGKDLTNRVYAAAFESLKTQPQLFVYGYVKGVLVYFDDLFRYAKEFKPLHIPLRFVCLLLPWSLGLWYAIRNWRDPRYALLLWLQAGIVASSPFIAIDGYNRVFASTTGMDATFVALGIFVLTNQCAKHSSAPAEVGSTSVSTLQKTVSLAATGLAAMFVPVLIPIAYRTATPPAAIAAPTCPTGQEGVVVRPGRSAIVLPLVNPGEESIYPLSVRADHFGSRFDRFVVRKEELRQPAGTQFIWGTRLDAESAGVEVYFRWSRNELTKDVAKGLCLEREPRKTIATAKPIEK